MANNLYATQNGKHLVILSPCQKACLRKDGNKKAQRQGAVFHTQNRGKALWENDQKQIYQIIVSITTAYYYPIITNTTFGICIIIISSTNHFLKASFNVS